MKVLYVSHTARLAGAEFCLLTLLRHLKGDRFEPVVVLPSDGPLRGEIDRLGLRWHLCALDNWIRSRWKWGSPRGPSLTERVEGLAAIIDAERPDLVHTNTSVVWEGAVAAGLRGVPHVWHVHEILEGHPRLRALFPLPLVYSIMDALSERVVAVSEAAKAPLSGSIHPERLVRIWNGVDAALFASGRPREPRPAKAGGAPSLRAAVIGAIAGQKGHGVLLEAVSLARRAGVRVEVLIVGTGSRREVRTLHAKIRALGLQDAIQCLGFREDVPEILAGSDLLIVSSLWEAFSLVIVEAMAAGLPVIATDCGGPREIVSEGETGYLVPPGDPRVLCDRIVQLAGDPERRKAMGENGRRRFSERFTSDAFAANIANLYAGVARARSGSPRATPDTRRALAESWMRLYQDLCDARHEIARLRSPILGRARRLLRRAAESARRWGDARKVSTVRARPKPWTS